MQIFLRYAAYTDSLPNRFLTRAYDARMLFIVSGKGEMLFGDRREPFCANTLLYYPPGAPYLPLPDPDDPPRFVTLNFDFCRRFSAQTQTILPVAAAAFDPARAINSHLSCGYPLFRKCFVLPHAGDFRDSFLEIAENFHAVTPAATETAEALLHYLCCRLAARDTAENSGVYRQITEYIALHYTTIQSNTEIAAALNYHPYYINQVFRQQSGSTLHRYVMELRLQKGAALLRDTAMPVAAVAAAAGFKNADHFSKCFSARYGIPPRRFRLEKIPV